MLHTECLPTAADFLSCLLLTVINPACGVLQERDINNGLWVASPFPLGQNTPVLCELCFISLQQIALTTLHQHKLLGQFCV